MQIALHSFLIDHPDPSELMAMPVIFRAFLNRFRYEVSLSYSSTASIRSRFSVR